VDSGKSRQRKTKEVPILRYSKLAITQMGSEYKYIN